MSKNRENLIKYLKILLYLHILSLVNGLLAFLPVFGNIWISRAISAGVIYCLFSLAGSGDRYKKSAIFRIVFLICGFITSKITVLVGSVCSIIASWQEYHGHGELVEEQNEKLGKQWNSLFGLELLVGILIALATSIITTAVVMNGGNGDITHHISIQLIAALGHVIDVLYLIYMNRTIKHFET